MCRDGCVETVMGLASARREVHVSWKYEELVQTREFLHAVQQSGDVWHNSSTVMVVITR